MIRFFNTAWLGLAMGALAACGAAPAPPPSPAPSSAAPREQLTRLVERYWDERLLQNPEELPEGAARRFDGAHGYRVSAQFLADSAALERRYLAALLALPSVNLDADSRLTYDLFRRARELAIESYTYPSELLPVNPARSLPLEFAQTGSGADSYAILSPRDFERWQARTDDYVRWTTEAIANMREGLRRGYALPRVLVEKMLPLLAALGADTPANVFYQSIGSIPATVADAERNRLKDGITAGVRDKILPAYVKLHDFLRDEYLPRARTSVGLSALPLGSSWYAFLIKRETDSALKPAEIQALGVAEVERLRTRLQSLLADTAFAGNAAGFLGTMHPDPNPLSFYGELKGQTAAALPALFSETPQAEFAIRRVESFRETTAPALSYQRAAADGRSTAVLYVNTGAIAAEPALASAALFLREAEPGHHFQTAILEERADLPRFRRFGGDPAFVEGWGSYAASLGEELGLYRDTESKFAALLVQLQCAAGPVVDTGLHSLGWTRERAIDYLHALLPVDEAAVRETVDRDLALPGEALGCFLGERKMQELRARAEKVLGPRFDIRAFHAQLLDDGALPLDILETKVTRWLDGLK
jgi:uncharacterized protein (DUF885 family)